jgi:hypothetical protein
VEPTSEGGRVVTFKGWIKFGPNEVSPIDAPARQWHQATVVIVKTACDLAVATDERPGNDYPGYGARICPTCLATKDEDS